MDNLKSAQEKIVNWLQNQGNELCHIKLDDRHNYMFFKIRMKEDIDMLFRYDTDDSENISVFDNPKYEGVYKISEDKLYGEGDALDRVFKDDERTPVSMFDVRQEFTGKVRAGVNAKVSIIEDDVTVNDEDRRYEGSAAESAARRIYLKDIETTFKYQCEYEDDRFYQKFIEYLIEPDKVIERTVNKFYANEIDKIKREIVRNKLTEEYLKKFENGEDAHVLALKRIIHSIPEQCKMVNVTTRIEGHEVAFKYEADMLRRDCGYTYSTWYIPAADRYMYEAMYGSHRAFTPEDITKITYSRNVLYERGKYNENKI